jgi:hypothetical protein
MIASARRRWPCGSSVWAVALGGKGLGWTLLPEPDSEAPRRASPLKPPIDRYGNGGALSAKGQTQELALETVLKSNSNPNC